MTAAREMTLSEWVNKLPKHHAAVREFDALIAHATEMEAVMKAKDRPDKLGVWLVYNKKNRSTGCSTIFSQANIEYHKNNESGHFHWFGPFNFALTETKRDGEG